MEIANNEAVVELGIWLISGLLVIVNLLIIYIWQENKASQRAQVHRQQKAEGEIFMEQHNIQEKIFELVKDMHKQQQEFTKYSSKIEVLVERHDRDIRNIWERISKQ